MNRRQLVKTLSLSGMTFSFFRTGWASHLKTTAKPIVLSTWYNQREANIDAWSILSKNGKALDAVEKGVMNAENDINNCIGQLNRSIKIFMPGDELFDNYDFEY